MNGEEVDITVAPLAEASGSPNDVIFVVDTSEPTDTNGMLTLAQQALRRRRSCETLPAGHARPAIVIAGAAAQVAPEPHRPTSPAC